MIAKFDSWIPWLIGGAIISTVGGALVCTFNIDTKSSHWITFQVIVGIGRGMSAQVSIIANQGLVEPCELASVTAMTLCEYTRCPARSSR